MSMTGLTWDQLLHERFGVYMPKGRPEAWLSEIRLTGRQGCGPDTSEYEVLQAIRFAIERLDEPPSNVKLSDVIMWVRWYRKDRREAAQTPDESAACAACQNGWVLVWLALPENPCAADFTPRSKQYAVPCLCSAGKAALATAKEYQGLQQDSLDRIREMARLGMRQSIQYRRVVDAEIEALLNPQAPVQAEDVPPWENEEGPVEVTQEAICSQHQQI